MVLNEQKTFQDVLDSKIAYDKSKIGTDSPTDWMWAITKYGDPTFYPVKKIQR